MVLLRVPIRIEIATAQTPFATARRSAAQAEIKTSHRRNANEVTRAVQTPSLGQATAFDIRAKFGTFHSLRNFLLNPA
jgi:hypothetical protein